MRVSNKLNFKLTCVKLNFRFNRKQFSKYLNSDFVVMLLIVTIIVDNETVYGQTELALDHWFLQSHGSDMSLPKIRNFPHEKQKLFSLVNKRILPDFHSEGNYDLLLVL